MKSASLTAITDGLENLSPERLQEFVQGMTGVLLELKESLDSSNVQKRADALELALGLRNTLEKELEALVQKSELDPRELLDAEGLDLEPEYRFVQDEIKKLKELFPKPKEKR